MPTVLRRTSLLVAAVWFAGGIAAPVAHSEDLRGLVLDLRPYAAARTDAGAAKKLSAAADALLKTPLEPVTAKRTLPASGDPRDYFSQAPYYWPDPAAKDGIPYIRRDGEVNPAALADSDRPRLDAFRDSFVACAAVYFATGDGRYADAAVARVEKFLLNEKSGMRPNLNHAQAIHGSNPGRSTGTIEAARLPEILDAARMLRGSQAWSDDVDGRFRKWCTAYADWLERSDFGREAHAAKNNIGTWCDVQRTAFAVFLDRPERARAMLETVKRRIDDQIAAEGSQPRELIRTRSFTYSLHNLHALMLLAQLGEHVEVDLWNYTTPQASGIRQALDYLVPYRDPQANWPHAEISKPPYHWFDELLLVAAEKYRDPKYRELAERFAP